MNAYEMTTKRRKSTPNFQPSVCEKPSAYVPPITYLFSARRDRERDGGKKLRRLDSSQVGVIAPMMMILDYREC